MVILQSQVQTPLSSGKLKEKSLTAPNHDFKHRLTRQLADLKKENENVKHSLDGADTSAPDLIGLDS
jgi:uncharacterized membrane-anchored protein